MLSDYLKMLYDFQELETRKEKLQTDYEEHPGKKELKSIRKQIEQMENEYKNKYQQQTAMRRQVMLKELKSKELDAQVRELENMIYSGQVQNIKELNKLQEKQNNLKRILDETYNEALNILQKLDELEQEISYVKRIISKLKKLHNEKRLKIKQELDKINEEIILLSARAKECENKIPADLMSKYQQIKKARKMPVSVIIEGRCSGCRMDVSVMVAQEVNRHDRIVFCENCGRILI